MSEGEITLYMTSESAAYNILDEMRNIANAKGKVMRDDMFRLILKDNYDKARFEDKNSYWTTEDLDEAFVAPAGFPFDGHWSIWLPFARR